jgi:diguanylate cyclase (GGDEF)-like protein
MSDKRPAPRETFEPNTASIRAPLERDWADEDTAVTRPTEIHPEHAEVRARDRATLTVLSGVNAGQVFALENERCIVGRDRDADVRIEDAGISRQHARIIRGGSGQYFVEDTNSTNGTFIEGRRVHRVELHSGDHVQFGPNTALAFSLKDAREQELARQLYESSTRDPLTGAFNRRYLNERLTTEVAYATRHRTHLAAVILDLDRFKLTNDRYGHLAGDQVLRFVAAQVTKSIRTEDVFARWGGEEFVVLVRGIDHQNVALFAHRLCRAVEHGRIQWAGVTLGSTVSIGVASIEECDNRSALTLMALADERLYRAKSKGRNCVVA